MTLDTADRSRPEMAQELLDHILYFLRYDSRTLKPCSLVSKSFLPTSQRHLFSTFRITDLNVKELEDFSNVGKRSSDDTVSSLKDRVAELLSTNTIDLTLVYSCDKNSTEIPPFLVKTWTSPTSRIKTVSIDLGFTDQPLVPEWLYILPTTVENTSFITQCTPDKISFPGFRKEVESRLRYTHLDRAPRYVNGTLKFHVDCRYLVPALLELGDLLKFNLKHINYRLYESGDVASLALLVGECKDTLQSLDVVCKGESFHPGPDTWSAQSLDLSRNHALRRVRIWTGADFPTGWLCTAISTIPRPPNVTPNNLLPRFELHISLPSWIVHPKPMGYHPDGSVEKIINWWIPVDAQLSQAISPDVSHIPCGTTTGITFDVSVTDVLAGPGEGIAASMFPLLTNITDDLPRLV